MWFNLNLPYAKHGDKLFYLEPQRILVTHRDERIIAAKITAPKLSMVVA